MEAWGRGLSGLSYHPHLPCHSTTVASTGTSEVKSRVRVLENIALRPSLLLQQCSCRDVRYKASPRAVGWKGPSLPLMRPQERHLSPCRERLTRQAPGNSLPLGQQEVWNLVLEIRDLYQKVRDDQAPKWTVLFMDPSGWEKVLSQGRLGSNGE